MKRIIPLLALCSQLLASARYGVMVDPDMSPYASAEDLILADRSLVWAEDYLGVSNRGCTFWDGAERLLELGIVWYPLERFTMVTQHEIFGHGWRIRSLGSSTASVIGYQLDAPPPYGPGGGSTSYTTSDQITTNQMMAIDIGGVEGTAVLANELKKKWVEDGCIDGRMAFLYLETQQDISSYMHSSNNANDSTSGHDINAYMYWLNATYPSGHITPGGMRGKSWYNYLDPMSFYSAWALWRYISTGQKVPVPMIQLQDWRLLPNLRVGLSPFCPELYFELFGLYGKQLHYAYIRGGHFGNNHTFGFGWECKRLVRAECCVDLGLRFDGWVQPGSSSYTVAQNGAGILAPLTARHQQAGCNIWLVGSSCVYDPIELEITIGWKSTGFMQGEPLAVGPIARIGLFGHF